MKQDVPGSNPVTTLKIQFFWFSYQYETSNLKYITNTDVKTYYIGIVFIFKARLPAKTQKIEWKISRVSKSVGLFIALGSGAALYVSIFRAR